MNYIDYTIIIIVLIGFLLGYKDGLVRKLIGLIGFVIGVFVAFKFAEPAGAYIAPVFNDDTELAVIIAGILIFLLVILLTSLIKRVIHPFDKVNRFLNQLLGGIAGVIQIVFFISGFLLFLNIFRFPSEDVRNGSLLYNDVYKVIPVTIDLIAGKDSKIKDLAREYIQGDNSFDFDDIDVDSTLTD